MTYEFILGFSRQALETTLLVSLPVLGVSMIVGLIVSVNRHEIVELAEREVGRLPVVLTGGCFQNARLVEDLLAMLTPSFRVYINEQVPPNDGGIALGQAVVAGALLRGERDPGNGAGRNEEM